MKQRIEEDIENTAKMREVHERLTRKAPRWYTETGGFVYDRTERQVRMAMRDSRNFTGVMINQEVRRS